MPADSAQSFAQLCADVVTCTNRPELMGEIQLAVRQATKQLHMKDFFLRDSTENIFQVPVVNYNFQFNVKDQFTRFRKIRYIKKYDLVAGAPKDTAADKLKECDPNDLFDRFSAPKNNVYYLAGDNLNIRTNTQENAFIIAWYTYPDTQAESFKSWIADLYDVAIVALAQAKILRSIGMTDDANRLEKEVEEIHWPIILANDIQASA